MLNRAVHYRVIFGSLCLMYFCCHGDDVKNTTCSSWPHFYNYELLPLFIFNIIVLHDVKKILTSQCFLRLAAFPPASLFSSNSYLLVPSLSIFAARF